MQNQNNNNENMPVNKPKSVGGLWKRTNEYGEYFSVSIEIGGVKHNFMAFRNRYKEEGDKKPDFTIQEKKQF